MKNAMLFVLLSIGILGSTNVAPAAEDAFSAPKNGVQKIIVKCKMCDGSGKLLCRPPDHGQYKGAIEAKSHWDVRMSCPFCNGRGRLKVYRTSMPPLRDGPPPCTSCGWTGVEKCHMCKGTGAVRCNEQDCRNGWVVSKQSATTSRYSSSSRMKVKVTPCAECKGVGKVTCTNCDGLRATVCRKCNGLGQDRKK